MFPAFRRPHSVLYGYLSVHTYLIHKYTCTGFDHLCTFVFRKVNILTFSWGTKEDSRNENSENAKDKKGAQPTTQGQNGKVKVITKKISDEKKYWTKEFL